MCQSCDHDRLLTYCIVLVSVQYSIQAVWTSGSRSGIEHVLSASQQSSDAAKEGTPPQPPQPLRPTKKMPIFCPTWRASRLQNRRYGRGEIQRITEPLATPKTPCPQLEAWCLERRLRAVREGVSFSEVSQLSQSAVTPAPRTEGGVPVWYRVETTVSPWQLHNAPHPLCRKTHRKYLFLDCVYIVCDRSLMCLIRSVCVIYMCVRVISIILWLIW